MPDLTQGITGLLFFSIVIQFVTEQLKNILPLDKIPSTIVKPQLWSLIVSLLVSFAFKVDMFSTLGYPITGPLWIGYLLTAILISGGSGVFNEIIQSLTAIKAGKFAALDPTITTTGTGVQINPEPVYTSLSSVSSTEDSSNESKPEETVSDEEQSVTDPSQTTVDETQSTDSEVTTSDSTPVQPEPVAPTAEEVAAEQERQEKIKAAEDAKLLAEKAQADAEAAKAKADELAKAIESK